MVYILFPFLEESFRSPMTSRFERGQRSIHSTCDM